MYPGPEGEAAAIHHPAGGDRGRSVQDVQIEKGSEDGVGGGESVRGEAEHDEEAGASDDGGGEEEREEKGQ